MMHADDDLATFDRLLGPDLVSLLEELESTVGSAARPPLAEEGAMATRLDTDGARGHDALRADIASKLVLVRRRIERGVPPPMRDERTMPLPFADSNGH